MGSKILFWKGPFEVEFRMGIPNCIFFRSFIGACPGFSAIYIWLDLSKILIWGQFWDFLTPLVKKWSLIENPKNEKFTWSKKKRIPGKTGPIFQKSVISDFCKNYPKTTIGTWKWSKLALFLLFFRPLKWWWIDQKS